MKTPKERRLIAESAINERIGAKIPSEISVPDLSYLILNEVKFLLEQLIDNQLETMGKDAVTRDTTLPVAEYRKGRRFWLWPKKNKK